MAYGANPPRYDDMLGIISSAATGGTAWNYPVQITGTPFVGGALRNNSTDIVQLRVQMTHRREPGSPLKSIHLHYVLQATATAGQTIVFTGRYVWVKPGTAIPATAQWTAMAGAGLTITLGNDAVRTYGIHSLVENIAAPDPDGYGSFLLVEITRGNGTYTGELFILDVDAHGTMDRDGSVNEFSD